MTNTPRLGWIPVVLCLFALSVGLGGSTFAQQPAPPAPPQGQGAISGTVVDGSSGEPVAGALVYLTGPEARALPTGQNRQLTDPKGRFAFVNLTGDAPYGISASKFGYLEGGYGRDVAPTDPLRPLLLKKDAWISNLRVVIWKPGSIAGAVRDEAGEPVVGVFVRALARFRIQGRDDLVAGPLAITDDRGAYRLQGLSPGRYVVQVPSVQASVPALTKMPPATAGNIPDGVLEIDDTQRLVIGRYPLPPPPVNGRQMTYPATFHPSSAALAQAMVIELKFGDQRTNVDLTLTPVTAARVSGIVEGPPEALRSLTLRLLPAGLENLAFGAEVATSLVGGDGRFSFVNVPAGNYTIDAPVRVRELTSAPPSGFQSRSSRLPMPPPVQGSGYSSNTIDLIPGLTFMDFSFRGESAYSGRTTVSVGATDVTGVVVRLRPHLTMSGTVIVEADPAKPDKPPPSIPVRLDPAAGEASLGMPQRSLQDQGAPGTFTIAGVQPGQYWLRVTGYPGWIPKSITWKGRDYLSTPFDTTTGDDFSGIVLTVTNATPELSGTVNGSNDVKAEAAVVVAFPVDRAKWRNTGLLPSQMKSATVSNAGIYRFTSLPAGDYLVAAIDRSLLGVWRDPDFLAKLERSASRVTLSWATKISQDLTAVVIR
jgi:hypothetical protein